MERIPDSVALTSTETASLLHVHPSTVKRWCNDGDLDSELTPGGHRRISVESAMAFARDREIDTVLSPFRPYEPHVWTVLRAISERGSYAELVALALRWARRGDFERLEQLYLALGRSDALSLPEFCDEAVRSLLSQVGHEWQQGKLRVGDEHMVTEAIRGALLSLRRQWIDERRPRDPSDARGLVGRRQRVAVVGTLEGNRHSIGSLCVRLLLEQQGWRVYYPGADVPTEDFGMIQKSREASLVCISLPPGGTLGDVARTLSILREHYDRSRPYTLAFGGLAPSSLEGAVPDGPFESVLFLPDVHALREALEGDSERTRPASPAPAGAA